MTKNELRNILKEIISSEIQRLVPPIVRKEIRKSIQENKDNNNNNKSDSTETYRKVMTHGLSLVNPNKTKIKTKTNNDNYLNMPKHNTVPKFSNNSVINNILKETATTMTEDDISEYEVDNETLNKSASTEEFTNVNFSGFLKKMDKKINELRNNNS